MLYYTCRLRDIARDDDPGYPRHSRTDEAQR